MAEVFPQPDTKSVPIDSAITVVFDRPVVPLTASTDKDDLPHPLVLSPWTVGTGEWVNSAVYVFTPAELLDSAAEYSVTIATDLVAVDGSALSYPVDWSFTMEAPSVTSINPRPTSDELPLNPRIQVRFNQAMDRNTVERAFFFRAGREPDAREIAGAFDWAEDSKGFAFTPSERLQPKKDYKAGFPPGLPFSPSGYAWTYKTVPLPAIKGTFPEDGNIGIREGGFSLFFESPMNFETLRDRITIEPAPAVPPIDYYSSWSERYSMSFDAQPSSEYTIHVEPGMEDIYGNAITEPLSFSFETGALRPDLRLHYPDAVGFYNAYRKPTQLYLSHRGVNKVNLALYHVPLYDFIEQLHEHVFWPHHDFVPMETELVRRWSMFSNAHENTTVRKLLSLGERGPTPEASDEGLPPGVYFLELSPTYSNWGNRHFLNVSTAVLTVKQTADRVTVWAVDIASGAPIVGERISLYGADVGFLGEGVTDERGIAIVDYPFIDSYFSAIAVLSTAEHHGIGLSLWSDGMDPPDHRARSTVVPPQYQRYLYTDRPVYRKGQKVFFRGLVRSKDDVVYMPAPFSSAHVTIRDAKHKTVYRRNHTLSDFGSFSGEFQIPQDAPLGYYYIRIEMPGWRARHDDSHGGLAKFLVAEYRLPEYQVTLSSERPEILRGETASFELAGRYFFGGPVANAAADFTVYSLPYSFNYAGDGYYDFSDGRDYRGWYEGPDRDDLIGEGSLRTDAAGVAQFDVNSQLNEDSGSQRLRVEASIRDEAGQTISANSDLVVHQGLLYLGARPEKYVTRIGEDSVFNIIAVDWEGQPVAEQDIDVQVVERRWKRNQEQDLSTGRVNTTWDVEEIPVTSGAVSTGADGEASFKFQPQKGGAYMVKVSTRDTAGKPY